jgi:TolB-like protein/DNA-binding winged helix-turn-helix (wHTH) protein/Tfp pilus assembly protein PilF
VRGDFNLNDWLIQPSMNRVVRDDVSTHIEPMAMRVLENLARQAGEVVDKRQLKKQVWGDTFVTDDALVRCVSELRKALGDDPRNPQLIQTIPRGGYLLIGRVGYGQEDDTAARVQNVSEAPRGVSGLRRVWRRWRGWRLSLVAAAGIVVALLAGAWFAGTWPFRSSAPVIRSLAVLPLQNLSGGADQEYLAEAMTEALITDLAGITTLQVASRTSILRFRETTLPISAIAQQLRVDALVEGTVLVLGNRVRITAQLIDGRTDRHLWSGTYEREYGDVLFLQKEVAQAVADGVRATLSPRERKQLSTARAVDPRAFEAYVKGRFFWNQRSPESLKKAVGCFEEAIRIAPDFAIAYSGLADAYCFLGHYGIRDTGQALGKSKEAARRALELDDSVAEAHASLALATMTQDWKWVESEAGFRKAIELKPSYAAAHHWLALCLAGQGRTAEGVAQARKARELDPVSLTPHAFLAQCLLWARRYDDAIRECRDALELHPEAPAPKIILAECYWRQRKIKEALAQLDNAKDNFPDDPRKLAATRAFFAGERETARKILGALQADRSVAPDPMFCAGFCALLGETDSAFRWLNAAFAQHASGLLVVKVDPTFDGLRSDPRFTALIERLGLNAQG